MQGCASLIFVNIWEPLFFKWLQGTIFTGILRQETMCGAGDIQAGFAAVPLVYLAVKYCSP